ncbi:MAG: 2-hydroxyacid dehydrogenase [Desulfobacterales bacterium]
MKITVIDDMALTTDQTDRLQRCGEVRIFSGVPVRVVDILARAAGAEIVVASWTKIDDTILSGLPGLKLISIWATGYDNVDVDAATRRKVAIAHVPGYATEAVAEMVFGLILAITRRVIAADRDVRLERKLNWHLYQGTELHGKLLGILGTGAIGARVAEIAGAFGLRVIAHDAAPQRDLAQQGRISYLPLDKVLAQSDILSLHLPLTADTSGWFSSRQFALMKPSAVFINTARAAIVDQAALWDALHTGKIAAAGLDDLDLDQDSAQGILRAENVVLTPHIGFNTREAIIKKSEVCIDNIVSFLQGRPQHIVNPVVLENSPYATQGIC